jgi:pimeloyl-ACP methyl ester carboxylesterase
VAEPDRRPEAAGEEARYARYPGAHPPRRRRRVDSRGIGIAVSEWGDPEAPPLLLAHGGFDFAATFSVFAPLLAERGFRVVSWDQRGHGDSDHAALYSWEGDARDALAVLDATTREPVPFVGHSKGGGVLTTLAQSHPHRVSHLVSIDGMPSGRRRPDVADHERTRLMASEVAGWLDHRRGLAQARRRAGTIEELARRRARMNPRLSFEWLCFLVTAGARRDPDGWRWKLDPSLRFGGFGPWRPEWALGGLAAISVPLLGILAGVQEEMGWETTPEILAPYLPARARIERFEDTGHFLHIEKPREIADLVCGFLGA